MLIRGEDFFEEVLGEVCEGEIYRFIDKGRCFCFRFGFMFRFFYFEISVVFLGEICVSSGDMVFG